MRFINVWAYTCANYLSKQLKESHEKKSVYYYGFQVIIGGIVKIIILISLALLVRSLVPALIILFVFGSLRVLAGGFHMDTYGKCIATSTILFIGAAIISQYTYKYWSIYHLMMLVFVVIVSSVFIIIRWAPKDTPNKPITRHEDIIKYKRLSLVYITFWTIISIALLYYGHSRNLPYTNLIIISSSMAILLELFMVTPFGYGFFESISSPKKQLHT